MFKRNVEEVASSQEIILKCFSEKKSENDFFAMIDKKEHSVSIETKLLTVNKSIPEDNSIKEFADVLNEKTREKFKIVIGRLATSVDAQFISVRSRCLPISNFVTDLLKIYMNTDCAILNAGSLRIDSYINEGDVT